MLDQRIIQIATTEGSVVCLCDDGTVWTRPIEATGLKKPVQWNRVPSVAEEINETSAFARNLRMAIPERSCRM